MYTILVIDDEPLIADSIMRLLNGDSRIHANCTVCKAYNAHEARFLIENEEVDIVVSDVRMPSMDGISFRDEISRSNPEILFLFISGYADFDNIYRVMKVPNTRFLLKTESDDVILKNVAEMVASLPPQEDPPVENHEKFVRQVDQFVSEHLEYESNLAAVSAYMNMNPAYLSRRYKQITGIKFSHMVARKKIDKAKILLVETNTHIKQISKDLGFGSVSSFTFFFKKQMGLTPSQYRNRHYYR